MSVKKRSIGKFEKNKKNIFFFCLVYRENVIILIYGCFLKIPVEFLRFSGLKYLFSFRGCYAVGQQKIRVQI